jgi:integrase
MLQASALTRQRRSEIGGLRVEEFKRDERQIELPGERTKNGLPHIVPLSDAAFGILDSIDTEGKEFFFGRTTSSGFSGWSASKAELDLKAKTNIGPFTTSAALVLPDG